MWRPAAVTWLGAYLMLTPGLWVQRPPAVALALVGGGLAICLALASALYPRALDGAAFVGALLALSAFLVIESPQTDGNRGAIGVCMLACGVAPRARRLAPGQSAH